MVNIAIYASGAGSNAQRIIDHFRDHSSIKIAMVVSNNPQAGVLQIAQKDAIPTLTIEKKKFNEDGYLKELKTYGINFIVLAGFMWKVPELLVNAFPDKMVNIHPALLPAYGGKGMYGNFVHEAVIKGGEKESGITIHYVDPIYDHGRIIYQHRCAVVDGETVESLVKKIHALEHEYYSRVIERVVGL